MCMAFVSVFGKVRAINFSLIFYIPEAVVQRCSVNVIENFIKKRDSDTGVSL